MTPLLEIQSLSLALGQTPILKEITMSLFEGEFVCLVGPNGAAKSTLMKSIVGIYRHYTGDVLWNGKNARSLAQKEVAKLAAYVPQGGVDQLTYTVAEFLSMARYPWRSLFDGASDRDQEFIDRACELAGVESLKERTLYTLSGGERQRVLIAAAVAQGSSLLLLDEPTTYLDYRHQQETLSLIRRINRERGVSIFAVTHDINFALGASHRVIALKEGQFIWEGTPDQLLEKGRLEEVYGVEFQYFYAQGYAKPYVAPWDEDSFR